MSRELGELEEARLHALRAVTLRQTLLGPEHPQVATAVHDLGVILTAMGRHAEAREKLVEAGRTFEEANSEDPSIGYVETDLALNELAAGEPLAALRHAELAVDFVREKLGSDALRLVDAHLARARAHRVLGHVELARADAEAAANLMTSLDDPEREQAVESLMAELSTRDRAPSASTRPARTR